MAVTLVDRVRVFTPTTGTGPLMLGFAVPGYLGKEKLIDGATYAFVISDGVDGSAFEIDTGVYSAAAGTLTRIVEESSSNGALLSLTGSAVVTFTVRAVDVISPTALEGKADVATLAADVGANLIAAPIADGSASADAFVVSGGVTKRAVLGAFMVALLASTSAQAMRTSAGLGANRTPQDLGAKCDGATDDAAALMPLSTAGQPVAHRSGTLRIATALTISTPFYVEPGALVRVDGVNLIILGPFDACILSTFVCVNGGAVFFSPGCCEKAYAEWFGAVANSTTDCTAAIQLALNAHLNVQAIDGTYLISSTLYMRTHQRFGGINPTTTTLATTSASAVMVALSGPAGGAYFDNVTLENMRLNRSVAASQAAVGSEASGAFAVKVTRCVRPTLRNLMFANHFGDIYYNETVNILEQNCSGGCALVHSTDRYFSRYIDGVVSDGSNTSPNASARFEDGIASSSPVGTTYGFYAVGNISDLLFRNCEAGNVSYGAFVKGSGNRYNVDVHFDNCIFDQHFVSGYHIEDTGVDLVVSINDGWGAPVSGATGAIVDIVNAWSVKVAGGFECVGWPSATSIGIRAGTNLHKLVVDETVEIQDCLQPLVTTGSMTAGYICPSILNTTTASSAYPAVDIASGANLYVAPMIDGLAGGTFASGVSIAAGDSNEVNGSKIVSAVVGTKLKYAGAAVTTASFASNSTFSGVRG